MPELEVFKSSRIELRDGKAVVFIAVKAEALRVDPEILGAVATLYGVSAEDLLKYINALSCWCCERPEDQIKKDALSPISELRGPYRLMGKAAYERGNICSDCIVEWHDTGETDPAKIRERVQKAVRLRRDKKEGK